MPRNDDELPPALRYVYASVTIDLGYGLATHYDGEQVPLVGQMYWLLALLLQRPGRVVTYRQLARELMPAYSGRHAPRMRDLDEQQIEALTRAMHTLVYRTRVALGERPGGPSILVNRDTIGYAIRRPLCIIPADAPDDQHPVPEVAPAGAALRPVKPE
jgi:DNA-binding response OmpR family regulator